MKKVILIVDDHPLFRKGLIDLLRTYAPDFEYLEAGNGLDALDITKSQKIDLMMLDVNMPKLDGMSTLRALKKESPDVKVVVFTQYDEKVLVSYMLNHGAHAYLLKSSEGDEIFKAIEMVLKNEVYINDLMKTALLYASADSLKLTEDELQVIQLLANGYSSKEISSILNISEYTIDTYRKRLLIKTKVKNTSELVSFAFKNAIIK